MFSRSRAKSRTVRDRGAGRPRRLRGALPGMRELSKRIAGEEPDAVRERGAGRPRRLRGALPGMREPSKRMRDKQRMPAASCAALDPYQGAVL
jgi:hypothetical protein